MKVLITGSSGQLGKEIMRQCSDQKKFECIPYDLPEFDLLNEEKVKRIIEKEKPDVIINCGAMTDVDACEKNEELAFKVNAEGPRIISEVIKDKDIVLVHLSSDYVFDGKGILENGVRRPYYETDVAEPQSVYGKSKKRGEEYIQNNLKKYFIIRSAWLYGDGKNFVRTLLQLSETRSELKVVNDQIGSPTSTVDLTMAILELIQTNHYGIYHATCEGECSWYDFAVEIFKIKNKEILIQPVNIQEYGNPTPRPKYSVLENRELKHLGMNHFRYWKDALIEYLQ